MTSVKTQPTRLVKFIALVLLCLLFASTVTPSYAKEFHGISSAVWSPDGRRIAFIYTDVGAQGSAEDLYVMGVESVTPAKMATDVESFVWSPDSKQIAMMYYNTSGITVMEAVAVGGPPPNRISTNGRWPAWSADGSQLYFMAGQNLSAMNADGSASAPFVTLKGIPTNVWQAQWSADRLAVAFLGDDGGDNDIGLYVGDKNGLHQLKTGEFSGSFSWSPDGKQLVAETSCENNPPGLCIYDTASGTARFVGFGHAPLWSPDGNLIAYRVNSQVCVIKVDGTDQRCLTEKQEDNIILLHQWSPDGTRLLFSRAFSPNPNSSEFRFEFDTFILDVQRASVRHWFDGSMIKP